ncbi:MAG: hypothetical protein QW587_08235 [Candidatus Bathyarchaeia archaeon]
MRRPRGWRLDERKARWVIREKQRRALTNRAIAFLQGVSVRRVEEAWRQFKQSGLTPSLKKPGRRREDIPLEVKGRVAEAYLSHRVAARMLEGLLRREGVKLSHNRVHRVPVEEGLAREGACEAEEA